MNRCRRKPDLHIVSEGQGGSPSDFDSTDVSFRAQSANGMSAAYDETAQILTIPKDATSPVTLTVTADDDNTAELREEFILQTSSSGNTLPTGYELEAAQRTVAILANENTVTIGDPSSNSIAENAGSATIAATINMAIPEGTTPPPTITITPSEGSGQTDARMGIDYSLSLSSASHGALEGNTWTLPTGAGSGGSTREAVLVIEAMDTPGIVVDRSFTLDFAGTLPTGWAATAASHTITITNDDEPGTVGFHSNAANNDSTAVEGGSAVFELEFSHALPAGGAVLTLDLTDVAPTAGYTFALRPFPHTPRGASVSGSTLTVPEGVSSIVLMLIIPQDDNKVSENISIEIKDITVPAGWEVGSRSKHDIAITDNDNVDTIGFATPGEGDTFNPARISEVEGVAKQSSLTVRVESTQPAPSGGFDLAWEVKSGADQLDSASKNGGAIDFSDGDEHKEFTVLIENDDTAEESTPVTLRLSTPTGLPDGWNFGGREYTFTIDPSDGFVEFADSTTDMTAREGGTLTFEMEVVDLVAPSTGLFIGVNIFNNESLGEEDINYTADVEIPAGQDSRSFTVEIIDDDIAEDEEVYSITLGPGKDWPIWWGNAFGKRTITIPASDNTVAFASPSSIASEGGTDATVAINIDVPFPSGTEASVRIDTENGGGARASDYVIEGTGYSDGVLTLPGTDTATLTVRAVPNPGIEDGESVTLMLAENNDSFPEGWEIGTLRQHVVTLKDAPTIGFTRKDSEAEEGKAAEIGLKFTKYTIPSGENINLKFDVSGTVVLRGVPSPDAHYKGGIIGSPLLVSLSASDNDNPSFSIDILPDQAAEREETLVLSLRGGDDLPSGVILGDITTHTVTIPSNSNFVGFHHPPRNVVTVDEGNTMVTLDILALFTGAPSGGLPLKIDITSGNENNLVTFNEDRTANNSHTFTVDEEQIEHEVTVYIADNETDVANNKQEVVFKLSEGDNFPSEWGVIPAIGATLRLIVVDDEGSGTIDFATPGDVDTFNPRFIFEENPSATRVNANTPHGLTVRVESARAAPSGGLDIAWEVKSGADQLDSASASGDVDFSAGDRHKEFTVAIGPDRITEAATPVTLRLSTPTSLPDGWNFGVQEYTFTIETSDTHVSFVDSVTDMTANEGDTLTFEVEIVDNNIVAPSTGAPIRIAFIQGNAAAGEDLQFEKNITIPAGQSRQSFTVEVIDDNDREMKEVYGISFGPGNGWPVEWGTALGGPYDITINASDNTVAFTSNTEPGTIAEESATSFTIELSINQPLPAGTVASVDLVPGGTASSGDYTLSPASGNNGTISGNTWTLPTGAGTAMLEITAVNDQEDEADTERVTFTLNNLAGATGWSLGSATTRDVDISDNDDPPVRGRTFRFASISNPPVKLAEGGPGEDFSISFGSEPLPSQAGLHIVFEGQGGSPSDFDSTDVSFNAQSANGMSAAYDETAQILTIPKDATSPVTLTVTAEDDSTAELREEFILRTSSSGNTLPTGYELETAQRTVAIAASDNTVTFGSPSSNSIAENAGSATIAATINMAIPEGTTPPPTITITPSEGSGQTDARMGIDYSLSLSSASHGTLEGNTWTLPTGAGSGGSTREAVLVIEAMDTPGIVVDRSFTLDFAGTLGTGWAATAASHTITITNDDEPGTVGFHSNAANNDSTAVEGGSAVFELEFSHALPAGGAVLTLDLDGVASTDDYTFAMRPFPWPPQGASVSGRRVTVPEGVSSVALMLIIPQDDNKVSENISIEIKDITAPAGWEVGSRSKHDIAITDNDNFDTIGFAIPSGAETFNSARIFEENPTNGMQHGVTVRVESTQPAPTGGFDLAWEVRSMEGDDQVDSTSGDIDFSLGDSHKEFTLMITKDNTREAETPVTVRLSTPTRLPTGWNFGVQEYTFTIETSDSNVTFSDSTNATTTANEGDTLTFELVIESIVAPSTGLPISILTHEGNDGEDLRFEETVIIPAGQSRQSFTVEVIDDSTAEDAETYNIAMTLGTDFPHSWGVVGGTRTITINPSDVTASFHYSGSSSVSAGDTVQIEMQLSTALSQEIKLNLVNDGTATYGKSSGDWNVRTSFLASDADPNVMISLKDNNVPLCNSVTGSDCQITMATGTHRALVEIEIHSDATSGGTIQPSIVVPSEFSDFVEFDSTSKPTLTIGPGS